MARVVVVWAVLAASWLFSASPARAEVFLLAGGGRIEGKLLNRDQSPRETFAIETASGRVTLEKSQVEQVLVPRSAELQYEQIYPTFPDTAEGQWKLAAWCLEQGLTVQRKAHLERVIELDPDHAEARRALGYSKIDGRWTTQEELMRNRGYMRYRGRWLLPQEVELLKKKESSEKAEKEWAQKVERWQNNLGTDRDASAREGLRMIEDPNAVKALSLVMKREKREQAKLLYIEALARVNTPEAFRILAKTSIEDPSDEVRLSSVEALRKTKSHDIVAFYVGQLKSKDNSYVNRAAVGLSHMGDRTAVAPLIDALVTVHRFRIGPANSNPGSISTTFSPNGGGGGGLSMGGGPKIIKKDIQNQAVLDALVMLTSANFGFEIRQWKSWFAAQKQRETLDARRN